MKKSELVQLIKEAISENQIQLKLGNLYTILDEGLNQWNSDAEYLGFDNNTRQHIFRFSEPATNNFDFVMIEQSEISNLVK